MLDCARLLDAGSAAVVVTSEPPRVVTPAVIVEGVAARFGVSTRVEEFELETPIFVRDATALEEALHHLLRWPRRCVLVVDAAGAVRGRLTVPHALRALFLSPPWLDALQLALHIETLEPASWTQSSDPTGAGTSWPP
jgi:hypothetical protein